ncbi:hypothetical protein YYG_01233 [Plasmodium vinckei petteri]|uniref:Uncharacterized protein n=1 Tax=Plasmodium vinckei petteri TaxID=138298 RepID=W7APB7_PLAVN|nr:hypothetical protein YYG_01233 [Plasmodium vinckei petteri]CAD2108259.1 conserved Plasmodium protein, unknown function [Plasmodium vinckei petteri]
MSLNNNNIVDLVKKKKEIIKEKKKQSKSHSSISTKSNNSENKNELNKNTLINNFVTSQKLLKDLQKRDNISLDTSLYLFNVEIDKIQKITKCAKWKNVPYIYQKSATEILLRKNEYISELNKKYKKSIDKKVSPNNVVTKRYSSNVSTQRNNNKKVSLRSQTVAQPVHKNLENSTKQKSVSNTRENNYSKKKNNDVFDKLAKKCSYNNTNNLKNNNIAHSNSHENINENGNKHGNCLFRCSGNYSASTNPVTQEKDENSKIGKENKIKNIKNYKGKFYENTKGLKKNDYYYYDNNNSGSRPRATSAFGIGSEKEKIEKRMESIQNINERNSIWCSYASKDLNNSSKDDENSSNQKYISNYFCYNNGEQDNVILNPVDQEANDIRTKWPEMSCSYFKANNFDENPNEREDKSIEIESGGATKKTIPNFERHTVSSFIKNLSVQKDILEKKQKQQVRENLKRMPTKQIVENSKKTYSSYDKTTQDNLKNLIKSQKKNDKNKMQDSSFEKIWNTVLKKQDTLNSVKNKSPNDKYDLYHVAPFNDNYSWVKNLRNYSSPAKLKNSEKQKEENKISSIMKVKKIKKNEIEEKVAIKGKAQNKDEQNKLEVDVDLPNDSLNCEDNLVEEDNNLNIKERNCFYNNYIFCGGEEPNENSEIEQENDNEEDDEVNKNNMKQYISVLENVKHNLKEGDKNPLEKFNERKSNNDFEIYEYVQNNENVKNNKIFEVLISPQKNINNKNKIITPKYAIKNRVIANNTQNLIPTSKKSISNVSNNLFGYQKYFQNNLNEKKGSNKYFTPSFKITSPLKSSNNNQTTSFQKNNANVNAQNSLETNAPIESKLMCNSCHTASNIKNVESLNSFDEQADKIIYNQNLSTSKELNTQKSGISNSSRDSKKCNEENANKSNGKFMFFCKNTNVLEKENNINNEIDHVDSINNIDPDAYAELDQNYSCYKTLCVYNKFLNKSNEHEPVNTLEEAKQIEQNILEKKKSEHFCLSNGMKLVTKNSEQHILNHKTNENIGKPITDASINSRSFSMDTKQQNEQAIEKNTSMNSIDMIDEQNGVGCFNIGCSYNSASKSNNEVEIKKEISEPIENYRINDTNVDAKMGFDKADNNGGCYFNLCKSKGVNSQEYFMKSFENIKSSDAENCEKRKTVSIIDNKNNDKIFEFENKNISNDRKQTYLQDPNDEDINLLKRKETYNHADTIVERKHTYNLNSMDNKNENNLNKKMSQEYVYINKIPSSHNYEVKEMKESIMNSKRATTYSFPVLKENSKNEEANSELIDDFVFIKNKIAIPKLKLDQMKHKNNHHFDIPNYEIKNPECFSVVQCNQVRLVPFIPPTDNNRNFNSMASFSKNNHPELLKIESNYLSTLNPHKANRSHTFNNNKINEIIVKNNNMLSSNPKKLSTTSACSRSHTFNLNQRIPNNNNIATNLTSEKYGNNSNAFCSESFISNVFPVFRKTVSKSNIRHGSKLKLPEYQSKTTFQDLKNNSNNVIPNFSYGNISSQSVELKVNDSVNCMNPCICQNVPKSELTNESHLDSGYINIESHNVIANSKCDKQNKSFENVSKKMEEKKNSIPRKQSYKDMILSFFGIKRKNERNEEKDDASNNCQNNGTMNVPKLYNTKSLGRVDSFHRVSKNSSNKNSNDLMTKQSNYFVPQKSFTRSNMNEQIINKTEIQGSSSIHNNNSNLPTNKINSTFGFSNYVNNTPMNINANTNASTKTKTHSLSFFELKNNKPSCTFESMNKVNSNSIPNNNFLCQNSNKQNDKIVSKIENNNIISSIPKVSSDLATPLNLNFSEKISTIGSNKSELNKSICNENMNSFKTCNNCIKEVENIKKENSNSTHIKESPLIESAFKDILSTERILQNSFKNNLPNKPISIPNIGIHKFFGNRTTESNIVDVQNDNIDVKSNITENKNINNEALEINKQNIDASSNFKEDTNNKCYNTYHQKNFQIIPFDKSDKKIIAKEVEPENKQVLNHNYTNLFISKSTIDILNKKINNVIYNPHSINMKFNPYDNMNQQNTDINNVILKPNISMDSKNSTTSALQQHIHLSNINQGPSYQTNNTQKETPKKDEPLPSVPVLSGENNVMQEGEEELDANSEIDVEKEEENEEEKEEEEEEEDEEDEDEEGEDDDENDEEDGENGDENDEEEGEEEDDDYQEEGEDGDEEEKDDDYEEGDGEDYEGEEDEDGGDYDEEGGEEGDEDYEEDDEGEDYEEEEDGENYEEEEGDDYEEEEEADEYEEEVEDDEYEYEEEVEDEEYEEGEEDEEYEEEGEDEEYEEEYEEESDTHLLSPPSVFNEHVDESKDDEYNPEMKYPEKYMKKLPPFNSLNIKNDKYKKMESSNDIFVLSPSNLSNIPSKNILSVYPPSTSSSFNVNLFEKKRKSISTLISKSMNSNEESNEGIYKNNENIYGEQDKKIPMAILRNDRESTFSNNNNSYKFFDEIAKQVEYEKKNNEQLKKKLKEQINMQRSLSKLREQQYAQLQFLKHKDVYNMNGNMHA